jgi:hypothetical protein
LAWTLSDDVAEPEGNGDDRDNPKDVNGEANKAKQKGGR